MTTICTPSSVTPPNKGLRALAIRGSLWIVIGQGIDKAIRLGSNLILTRMLFPEAFGLMILVGAFMGALKMFSDFGITQNIIQHERGEDTVFLNTAWTVSIIRGVILWLLAILSAWPLAVLYNEPMLFQMMPVVGLAALIGGFQSTSLARLNRHLCLGKLTAVEVISKVVSLVTTLVWVWIHPTVWALVAGGLMTQLVRTILSFLVLPGDRHRFAWDKESLRTMFSFGVWVMVSTIIMFLTQQLDRIALGKMVDIQTLGIYGIATIWILLPNELFERVAHAVLFPVISRLKAEDRDLAGDGRKMRLPLHVLGGLIVCLLVIGARDLIVLLYDDRYIAAGPILQLMAIGCWFSMISRNHLMAALALGNTKLVAAGNTGKLLAMIITGPVGFYINGIHGLVLGIAIAELVRYIVLLVGVYRLKLTNGLDDLIFTILNVVICLITMGLMHMMEMAQWNHWLVWSAGIALTCLFWFYPAWKSAKIVLKRKAKNPLENGALVC
jgi:O-antigen/teichoic acid export membrane protein